MSTLTVFGIEIPEGIHTLDTFREWVATLDEHAPRVHFYEGRVDLDMSPQHYRSHGPVVSAIARRLATLAEELDLGRYFIPPSWVTVGTAGLSTEPDGFLVKWGTLTSGQVRVNPTRETELLGRPDMVLEVVSKSSAKKDLVELPEAYARAGVPEYWIADARGEAIDFRILVLTADGSYQAQAASADGWIQSKVWGRAFRLERFLDRAGLTDFRLLVREV